MADVVLDGIAIAAAVPTGAGVLVMQPDATTPTLFRFGAVLPSSLGAAVSTTPGAPGTIVPVIILDTDLASDCDDAGDVAMVCQAVLTGAAKCLAMVAGNLHPNGATGLKVLLDYALPGHNILIGQYNGGTLNTSATYNGSSYLDQIVARFGSGTKPFPSHVNVVRRALAFAAPGSVSYVMTGFGSALRDILQSTADSASPLAGQALFKAKVKIVYWATCIFPSSGTAVEFNVAADIAGAQYVVTTLATLGIPVVFSGDEVAGTAVTGADRITAAPPSGTLAATSPYEYAFELFGYSAAVPRNAWGHTAIWPAIYGAAPLFAVGGANGTTTITATGTNTWAASPAAGQSYLARLAPVATASASFNTAIAVLSGNLVTAGGTWGVGAGFPATGTATAATVGITPAGSVPPPLGAVSVAALAAWGLRKMRAAYAGSAIRIQRTSDSTQLDIGFAADRTLDVAAMLTFVGSANAFITTWYDQSGNGYNLVQPAANNAQVVGGGTAIVFGASGRSAAYFLASSLTGLRMAAFPLTGTAVTVTAVASQVDNVQFKNLVAYQATGQLHHYDNAASCSFLVSNAQTYAIGTNRNATTGGSFIADTNGILFVASSVYDGVNGGVYRDGVGGTSYASAGSFGPTGTLDIGYVLDGVDASDAWAGPVCEVCIHASALSNADRTALWANMKAFYGTP